MFLSCCERDKNSPQDSDIKIENFFFFPSALLFQDKRKPLGWISRAANVSAGRMTGITPRQARQRDIKTRGSSALLTFCFKTSERRSAGSRALRTCRRDA